MFNGKNESAKEDNDDDDITYGTNMSIADIDPERSLTSLLTNGSHISKKEQVNLLGFVYK
jgi:hypothetical protein